MYTRREVRCTVSPVFKATFSEQVRSFVGLVMTAASVYHHPVMVDEVLTLLRPERGGVYLDGTLGGGGHAAALLECSPDAELIGVDRDPDALAEAEQRLNPFAGRITLLRGNFADVVSAAGSRAGNLAGALLDLGVSSHQLDEPQRGFTFRPGAPLDMRMAAGAAGERTAAELLAEATEEELARWFFRWGEERRARKLARTLVAMRADAPIDSSDRLVSGIVRAFGPRTTTQEKARIFQALRIATNREIDALETALPAIRAALAPGGVLVVLAYHSLEDRVVKNSFREWSRACVCLPGLPVCHCRGKPLGATLTRKPLRPSDAEVEANPRARSAALRGWEKAS